MDKSFQLRKHYEQTYYCYIVKGVFLCEKIDHCRHDAAITISFPANSFG